MISDFQTMTRQTRARFEKMFLSDFLSSSEHLIDLHRRMSSLISTETLAYFDQNSDWSKAAWVTEALETITRSQSEVVRALEQLGQQASQDRLSLQQDSLTDLEEEVKRLVRQMARHDQAVSEARSQVDSTQTPNIPMAFADEMEGLYASFTTGGVMPDSLAEKIKACADLTVATVLLSHAISEYEPFTRFGGETYVLQTPKGKLSFRIKKKD